MKNNQKNNIIIGLGIAILIIIILVYFFVFRSVTVSFSLKIGPGIAPVKTRVGTTINEPTIKEVDGYKFVGWFYDEKEFDFTKPINKSITLEAKWEKIDN